MPADTLVIGDDAIFAGYVRKVLRRYGYQVTACHSARDTVWTAAENPPDLVILDVVMPGMDGWEVCQCLRTISNVPILMCTALGDSSSAIRGLSLGADDYVGKERLIEELHVRVEALLRRARWTHSAPPVTFARGGRVVEPRL